MDIIILPVLNVIKIILNMYLYVIFASVIMSWLTAFGLINSNNRFIMLVQDFLGRVTEPALQPIRRILPNLGGLDLSPLVLILAVILITDILTRIQLAIIGA